MNTTTQTKGNTVQTQLMSRLKEQGVRFSRDDAWRRIEDHVETHKYLLDLRSETEVAWTDAIRSWEERVARPLLDAARQTRMRRIFPQKSSGDLLIELSDHWYFLKQDRPSASPKEAAQSYAERFAGSDQRPEGLVAKVRRALDADRRRHQSIVENLNRARIEYDVQLLQHGMRGFY